MIELKNVNKTFKVAKRNAGLKKSHVTELNKGVNLSEYVEIKSDIMF